MNWRRYWVFLVLFYLTAQSHAADIPAVMLARVFHGNIDVTQFWVSEKLDGVRARWDGKRLISKGGQVFAAPAWFIQGLPDIPLDGELWMARGRYEEVVSIVRKQTPHAGWKRIKLMVFDLPGHQGGFSARVSAMRDLASQINSPYLAVIQQFRLESEAALMRRLDETTRQGGEGLMLQKQNALYQIGRSDDLLKVKSVEDAEAVVIGYKPGKGKNIGMMGSVKVRTDSGKVFYIGSGFSQAQRRTPPALGSMVTYHYQGFTEAGIPRFAVFMRVRDEVAGQ
jgi:DNA ligase 1